MILNTINLSDNIKYLKTLPDNSVDAVITDSPYGLGKKQNLVKILQAWITTGYLEITGKGFMGKKWDAFVPQPILWKECLRVLKPGGYLLSFFGTRTYHLGSLAIELAGFEIRDQIDWIYGSGFPKSKASLKPGHEPICVARKPGPLQLLGIDECRIALNGDHKGGLANRIKGIGELQNENVYSKAKRSSHNDAVGRWPANIILDDESVIELDKQSGILKTGCKKATHRLTSMPGANGTMGKGWSYLNSNDSPASVGGASRFFYCAKASPSDRQGFTHPTIKPVKLMTHLVKLFCPKGGVVVDPHNGTGPTCEACLETGRNYIGIDNDPVSHAEANTRIDNWHKRQIKPLKEQLNLFSISA